MFSVCTNFVIGEKKSDRHGGVRSKEKYENENKFAVKCSKSPGLQDRFWGLLKFSGVDIINMDKHDYFSTYDEIGDIVNQFKFSCIHAGDYLDLGTWDNYNYYLKNY